MTNNGRRSRKQHERRGDDRVRNNERKKEKDISIAGGELVKLKNSEKGGKKNLKKTNTQERQRKVSNLCLSE